MFAQTHLKSSEAMKPVECLSNNKDLLLVTPRHLVLSKILRVILSMLIERF